MNRYDVARYDLNLSLGWSWEPDDQITVAGLEASLEWALERLDALRALCDNVQATCYRTGDAADERCHREGCAHYTVAREAILDVLDG